MFILYGGGERVVIFLFVDDILTFGTSHKVTEDIKTLSSQCFEKKDVGETNVILNIKVLRD